MKVARLLILTLFLLPGTRLLQAEETQAEQAARARAEVHFSKAIAMTRARPMYEFTKEQSEALLGEYEQGLEVLLSAAEDAPNGSPEAVRLAGSAAGYLRGYANHALRRYRYDRVYEYWRRVRSIDRNAQIWAEFASAMALAAHGALARDQFDEAITIFREMASIAGSGTNGQLAMASYHPEFYGRIARRAKELAEHPVQPEYTAKVFSLRIGLLRFKWKQKGLSGEGDTEVTTSPLKIKKGDVELADLAEESLRRTVLAMSDGKLDLKFERLALVDPVEVILPDGQQLPDGVTRSPSTAGDDIIDRAAGAMGDQLRERAKANDIVILFWWGTSPLTQHGGARTFRIDAAKRLRGNINIGVQFFHYDPSLDYMNCGACPGPNGIGFYPHVYMHEFFHVVEARFGIKPVHGFAVPAQFPGWQGRDEVDYYWWQIRENIPALRKSRGKQDGWRGFSYM